MEPEWRHLQQLRLRCRVAAIVQSRVLEQDQWKSVCCRERGEERCEGCLLGLQVLRDVAAAQRNQEGYLLEFLKPTEVVAVQYCPPYLPDL